MYLLALMLLKKVSNSAETVPNIYLLQMTHFLLGGGLALVMLNTFHCPEKNTLFVETYMFIISSFRVIPMTNDIYTAI